MRKLVKRQGYRVATVTADGQRCSASNSGPESMCGACRPVVARFLATKQPPKLLTTTPKPVACNHQHHRSAELERRVEAEIARLEALPPPPIDMAARIREARGESDEDLKARLHRRMTEGISYDHM